LWFAAIEGIESKQNLTGLAPKGCFVSAEAVERDARAVSSVTARL
jgi:hypothetical protein